MAKKKWHVVIVGTEPGIYETWYVQPSFQMPELSPASDGHAREDLTEANRAEAGPKVIGVPGNIYESYKTPQEAHNAYENARRSGTVKIVNMSAGSRAEGLRMPTCDRRLRIPHEHHCAFHAPSSPQSQHNIVPSQPSGSRPGGRSCNALNQGRVPSLNDRSPSMSRSRVRSDAYHPSPGQIRAYEEHRGTPPRDDTRRGSIIARRPNGSRSSVHVAGRGGAHTPGYHSTIGVQDDHTHSDMRQPNSRTDDCDSARPAAIQTSRLSSEVKARRSPGARITQRSVPSPGSESESSSPLTNVTQYEPGIIPVSPTRVVQSGPHATSSSHSPDLYVTQDDSSIFQTGHDALPEPSSLLFSRISPNALPLDNPSLPIRHSPSYINAHESSQSAMSPRGRQEDDDRVFSAHNGSVHPTNLVPTVRSDEMQDINDISTRSRARVSLARDTNNSYLNLALPTDMDCISVHDTDSEPESPRAVQHSIQMTQESYISNLCPTSVFRHDEHWSPLYPSVDALPGLVGLVQPSYAAYNAVYRIELDPRSPMARRIGIFMP